MKLNILIIFAIFIIILLFDSFYVIEQREQAIVLQFGKPVTFKIDGQEINNISEPGLKFKLPFIQEVKKFNKRILTFEATDKEVLDIDKKNLTVNAFAKYQIIDPLKFYQKVTDISGIKDKLDRIFEAALRDEIGEIPLSNLLTKERTEIMSSVLSSIAESSKDFGITIFDVRIIRADLPTENSEAIYKRMRAEREKEAREYRAEGEEKGQIIRSTADKTARITIAKAKEESLKIKGTADATAAKIYADAFNQDKEFFKFYRSMQALDSSFGNNSTQLILSPDSGLLEYIKEPK